MCFKRYTYLVCHKLIASITLTGETLKVVSLKTGTKHRGTCCHHNYLIIVFEVLANVIRWENEIRSINIG